MQDENRSAISLIRALRDELRTRHAQNEDYRALKALDEVLRELEPPTLPKAIDFTLTAVAVSREDTAKRA